MSSISPGRVDMEAHQPARVRFAGSREQMETPANASAAVFLSNVVIEAPARDTIV